MQVNSVGVIGAGTMGNGIAQVFAAAGFKVILHDIADAPLQRGLDTIEKNLDRMLQKEKISAADKSATLANISGVTSLDELAGADLIVESASENLEIKSKIFQ